MTPRHLPALRTECWSCRWQQWGRWETRLGTAPPQAAGDVPADAPTPTPQRGALGARAPVASAWEPMDQVGVRKTLLTLPCRQPRGSLPFQSPVTHPHPSPQPAQPPSVNPGPPRWFLEKQSGRPAGGPVGRCPPTWGSMRKAEGSGESSRLWHVQTLLPRSPTDEDPGPWPWSQRSGQSWDPSPRQPLFYSFFSLRISSGGFPGARTLSQIHCDPGWTSS